jgi:D-galactarolactone cycloisomerase
MKITAVSTMMLAAAIPPARRWRNDAGTAVRHEAAIVVVETDEGITGYGEAKASPPVVKALVEHRLAPLLLGEDPTRVEYLWELMYSGKRIDLVLDHGRPYRSPNARGDMTCAISGVDVALWDILGKSLELPIYKLLGGGVRDRVRAYASGGWAAPGAVGDELAGYLDQGFTAVKMRVGGMDSDDFPVRSLQRLAEGREAIGPHIGLMMDAHGALTVTQALELARGAEQYNVAWFEEPVTVTDDLDGLARVRARTTIPIATGEHEQTRFAFRDIVAAGAADVLQPDIAIAGGITETRRIAALAHAHGLVVNPHCWGSALLWSASAHVAAATPNCVLVEVGQGYNPLLTDLVTTPISITPDGFVVPPEGPGIGVELQPDAERKYPYA